MWGLVSGLSQILLNKTSLYFGIGWDEVEGGSSYSYGYQQSLRDRRFPHVDYDTFPATHRR
jgi:hypothetical protein